MVKVALVALAVGAVAFFADCLWILANQDYLDKSQWGDE